MAVGETETPPLGSKTSPAAPKGSCETSRRRSVHLTPLRDVSKKLPQINLLAIPREKKKSSSVWFTLSWLQRHPITLFHPCSKYRGCALPGTCGRRHVALPKIFYGCAVKELRLSAISSRFVSIEKLAKHATSTCVEPQFARSSCEGCPEFIHRVLNCRRADCLGGRFDHFTPWFSGFSVIVFTSRGRTHTACNTSHHE